MSQRLPSELIIEILRHVYLTDPSEWLTSLRDGEAEEYPLISKREQFKLLRLEGRLFSIAVTPAVFASIHLHDSELSLARARSIAESRLAHHVREVIFHQGSFRWQGGDSSPDSFQKILASHRRRGDYPAALKGFSKAQDQVLYANYTEEIQATPVLNRDEFGPCLLRCSNVGVFLILKRAANEWHDIETSAYTLRRTGLSYLPALHTPTFRLPGQRTPAEDFRRWAMAFRAQFADDDGPVEPIVDTPSHGPFKRITWQLKV